MLDEHAPSLVETTLSVCRPSSGLVDCAPDLFETSLLSVALIQMWWKNYDTCGRSASKRDRCQPMFCRSGPVLVGITPTLVEAHPDLAETTLLVELAQVRPTPCQRWPKPPRVGRSHTNLGRNHATSLQTRINMVERPPKQVGTRRIGSDWQRRGCTHFRCGVCAPDCGPSASIHRSPEHAPGDTAGGEESERQKGWRPLAVGALLRAASDVVRACVARAPHNPDETGHLRLLWMLERVIHAGRGPWHGGSLQSGARVGLKGGRGDP